jgi:hypothetical protein
MLDATVQSAFVVVVAWLIQLGANAAGFPLDAATIASVAAVIVAYILSKLGVATTRSFLVKRGILSGG